MEMIKNGLEAKEVPFGLGLIVFIIDQLVINKLSLSKSYVKSFC